MNEEQERRKRRSRGKKGGREGGEGRKKEEEEKEREETTTQNNCVCTHTHMLSPRQHHLHFRTMNKILIQLLLVVSQSTEQHLERAGQ